MNHKEHPDVFLNHEINTPNQHFFKREHMTDWMMQQSENHEELDKKIEKIRKLHRKLNARQRGEVIKFDEKLEVLQKESEGNKETGRQTMEDVAMLDARTQEMGHVLESSQQTREEIIEKLGILTRANEDILQQLMENEEAREVLTNQINEVTALQRKLSDQITDRESQHENIVTRLESHEALLEKLSRQMSQFRSIIYERAHFLQEKIEDGYKVTSNYMYHLLDGDNRPFTLELDNQEKQKAHKES